MNPILNDAMNFFCFWVRFFRSKLFIYLIISRNQLEIKNLETGKMITQKSTFPFSSNRLLIANNLVAEKLGREMMNMVCGGDLKFRHVFVILHPLETGFDEICQVEKLLYNDFGTRIGAHGVILSESLKKLNAAELNKLIVKNH
ncbi:hypothetical protein [Pararhodonellum marinum]|uniref:hypothetical protein n=1 Tax=Pararhodonellum marinum TaxID=2755358 RepID=UPI00188F2DEF|nr:hypothetical protein [Pararhodonellum marinum]